MNSRITAAYSASPWWVQNAAVSAYGYWWRQRRFGGRFREHLQSFIARDRFTQVEWRAYQTNELRETLIAAAAHVPFYQSSWNRDLISNLREVALEDLREFPLLDKEQIRTAGRSLIARNAKRLRTYATSGTTGTPLSIVYSAEFHRRWSAAYEARCRRWAGVNHRMSRAMLGGRLITGTSAAAPPYWRFNVAERQLYLSAFHISPSTAPSYVSALNRYRPDYLVGYASAHFFLARFIVQLGLVVHRPKAVLTSSESMSEGMRALIERAYGCEVFDAYSGVEACCLASECEEHRLHISPDVGIVELVREDGRPAGIGEPGEIVATGLLNHAQPLIRYRTGDWAVLSQARCTCGREMPVLDHLVGRIEDTVVGSDGRELVRFHGIFVDLPHVREGQVVQEAVDRFLVRLAVDAGFGEGEREEIRRRFEERLGRIELRYEFVDSIERTSRGKFRAVVSRVSSDR